MASSASGEQSLSLSSTSGRTTMRFSVGSPEGDDAMAIPSLLMADTGERIVIADGETVDAASRRYEFFGHCGCGNEVFVVKLGCFTCYGGNLLFRVKGKAEIPAASDYRSAGSGVLPTLLLLVAQDRAG